jgi:hypothetical protein
MYLRLRQICLVARALDPVAEDLQQVLGLGAGFRDAHVGRYGLVNAVMAAGSGFIEVVAPTRPDTAAGRYLERRGGDGGYMVILDCDDLAARRRHVEALGARIANAPAHDGYAGLQLHPRDTGGAMLELNHTDGGQALDGPYHPAGPGWRAARRTGVTTGLLAAEIAAADPAALAGRWSEILERPAIRGGTDAPEIRLDLGVLRFVPAGGRGEGLVAAELAVADPARIRAAAAARGLAIDCGGPTIGGVAFRLRAP